MPTRYNNMSEAENERRGNYGEKAQSVLQKTQHFAFLQFYVFCFSAFLENLIVVPNH